METVGGLLPTGPVTVLTRANVGKNAAGTRYLLGVSTRRMDKLVASLGITSLSKSQVSEMAKELDAHVEALRTRRLDETGPFTFVAADALVLKVREGGRVAPVHALVPSLDHGIPLAANGDHSRANTQLAH